MSNLQVVARRCPVMSKALAIQSCRSSSVVSAFGRRSGGISVVCKRNYVVPSKPVNLHATSKSPALAADVESMHLRAGVFDTSKGV